MRERHIIIRLLERLAIFLLGIVIIYFVVDKLYPWLHERLPLVVAMFGAYLITAYLLLPAIIRVIRLFWKPMHIPAFTYSGDGWKLDPVNIGIVATEKEFVAAMQKAGWHMADRRTWKSVLHLMTSIVFNRRYNTAPVSTHFLFGRPQDYAFEIPLHKSPRQRHHVRFWACVPVAHPTFKEHFTFWQERHKGKMLQQKMLWIGAATFDIGLAVQKRNLQITHDIESDSGKERDFVIQTLEDSKQLQQVTLVHAHEPYFERHQTFMTRLIADGTMKVCELRDRKKHITLKRHS